MFSILLSHPFPFVLRIVWELTSSSIVRRAYRDSLAGSFWRKDADNRTWFICLIYVGLFDFAKLTSSMKKDVRLNVQLKGARREWEISVHSSAKLCTLILLHAYCSAPLCILPTGQSLGAGLGDCLIQKLPTRLFPLDQALFQQLCPWLFTCKRSSLLKETRYFPESDSLHFNYHPKQGTSKLTPRR